MKEMTEIYIIGMLIVTFAGYALSFNKFCEKYLGKSRLKGRGFTAVFFLGLTLMWFILEKWYVPYILAAICRHALFFCLVLLMFRESIGKKIFAVSLLITTSELVKNLSCSIFSCLILFLLNRKSSEPTTVLGIVEDYGIGCISFWIAILAVNWLARRLTSVFSDKVNKWYLIQSVSLLFIVVIVDVVNFGASIGISVVSNVNGAKYWNIYHNEILNHVAIFILTVLSMGVAGLLIFGMDRIYMEQKKREQYKAQVAFYRMLEEQYSQMERVRHDFKNHIISLGGLLENRQWEKMESYLIRMMESGNLGSSEEVTGNQVVDALIYQKRKQAEQEGISWECGMQIPRNFSMEEFDLCVLLGNILDNAIEACERLSGEEERFIQIQSGMVKKCFFIEVKNSTNISELGCSQKEKAKEHGIGLWNIKDTVHKYNGVVNTEIKNNIFLISILLPFVPADYDKK